MGASTLPEKYPSLTWLSKMRFLFLIFGMISRLVSLKVALVNSAHVFASICCSLSTWMDLAVDLRFLYGWRCWNALCTSGWFEFLPLGNVYIFPDYVRAKENFLPLLRRSLNCFLWFHQDFTLNILTLTILSNISCTTGVMFSMAMEIFVHSYGLKCFPVLSSSTFSVSVIMPLIHFDTITVQSERYELGFIHCASYPFSQNHLLSKLPFLQWSFQSLYQRSDGSIRLVMFVLSILLVIVSIFMPALCFFSSYFFIVAMVYVGCPQSLYMYIMHLWFVHCILLRLMMVSVLHPHRGGARM